MINNDPHTDLGMIKIYKTAIRAIAAIAAIETSGVKAIKNNFFAQIALLWGKKNIGIRVDFDRNSEINLDMPLVIKYGYSIPEVSAKVQENVRHAVEKATDLTVKDVHIKVQGVEKEAL